MQEQDLITLIVPIYNVENYLNECIESIVAQTYANLEIILINDGSTDNCEKICLEWRKKDNRIIYVSKANETLGPTRNLGIQMAKGKYIAFVDSDDWIDSSFIQKLYSCVTENDKDFARCDYYIVDKNKKLLVNNNEYYPFNEVNIRRMIASGQAITIVTGLYKKSLWTENKLEMPSGPHQDLAILGLLFLYAKKIGLCKQGLYYYRENRQGNISMTSRGHTTILPALKYLISEYKRRKLFDEYREELKNICINRSNMELTGFIEEKNLISKHQHYVEIKEFLNRKFGILDEYYDNRMIAIGSYNLQRVLSRTYFCSNIEDLKFQHSSIISIMSFPVKLLVNKTRNFKDRMIWADCQKKLITDLQETNIRYVLIDFIEERNDIWDLGNGKYITDSEAFKEKEILLTNARLIKRDTQECKQLWERKCKQFISILKKKFIPQNIFLIKFFLAEGFGEYGKEQLYKNVEEIRRLNKILDDYYTFFEQNYSGVNIIQLDQRYFYTEICAKFGCVPWHLNIYAQFDIQNKVKKILESSKDGNSI